MAVRDDFAAGEVLAAADLNDTFASKVDYALPTNAQTGTAYTFVADDAERLTTASNGSAVTFTIPPQSSVTWGDDTILRVVNYGAGALTVDGGSGVTVTNTATTVAQYQAAAAIRTGSDAWTLVPFAGGGEIPAAEISSPAATGQYTDSGTTYDYYTFTASGTLTVDTAGFADILVVGGGGGGGTGTGGGGGGGGMLQGTQVYLSASTHSVTVGAGGSGGGSTAGQGGFTGNTSRVGVYYGVGGGGGGANSTIKNGQNGGSGGGSSVGGTGGSATPAQGFAGESTASEAGGGGGAGENGGTDGAGYGGDGAASSITGSSVTYAGGGAGFNPATPSPGDGGGGALSTSGTANTGGGGGGWSGSGSAGSGGSGVVIVRVKV